MTKKQKEALMNEQLELKSKLYSMLLGALGFDVDESGCIYDQDSMSLISMNGGRLLYSPNNTEIARHRRDMIFDPVHNRRLTEGLFKTFLAKEEEDNDLYVKTYYPKENPDGISIVCVLDNGKLESESYRTAYYGFLELITGISNSGTNTEVVNILKRIEEINNDLQ